MRLWVLGSGSNGNSILLEAGDTRILIDAGFFPRTLAMRLRSCGAAPESIQALIVTHEHLDHVRGAAAAASRWGWEIHASTGTVRACRALSNAHQFRAGETVSIGNVKVQTIRIAHDAAEPVAIVACDERTGVRAAVAHDLGGPNEALRRALAGVDVLVLESNYDEEMLRTGPYPPFLRARIAGAHGHLDNRVAGQLARGAAHAGLWELVLAHLSEENNTPAAAHREMTTALRGTRFSGRLTLASQREPCGPFEPRAGVIRARQLQFAL